MADAAPTPLTHEEAKAELLECARYGELEDLLELLTVHAVPADTLDAGGSSALMRAAGNGHLAVVAALLDAGASACTANAAGNTALHWAALNGHAGVVDLLLSRGGPGLNVLAVNSFGKSALSEALNAGNEPIAAALLGHPSADPAGLGETET